MGTEPRITEHFESEKEKTNLCPECGREKRPNVNYDDDDALRKLNRYQLAAIIDVDKPGIALVAAIRELSDRLDGKAPQSIAMTVKTDPAASLSDDQLAALLAMLPEPMIIPPMPKRIED